MSWGGLNPALTAFRNGVNARFPARGTQSDGGYADKVHGSTSQHQPDTDGTVDAFDMDVNLQGSSVPAGTASERALVAALRADFEGDPRSQLWISRRKIANRDVSDWLQRSYTGDSPHDEHCHFQSRQSLERDGRAWAFPETDALLRGPEREDDMTQDQLLDALESPRGRAALRSALTEAAYGPTDARESIAGRVANIDSRIDSVSADVVEIRDSVRTLVAPKEPAAE